MKVRTRLFVILLVTSLIPLVVFSAVSITSFVKKSIENTYQTSEYKLEVAKTELANLLEKNLNALHTIANQPAIKSLDYIVAKQILVNAAKVNPDLVIALDNALGDQIVKSNDDSLTNVSDRDFFNQAISGKEEYVSDIILARTTGKLMVVMSHLYVILMEI